MNSRNIPLIAIVAASLAVLGGITLAAQDRYSLQVPGGLAFSEFRGYEDWQVISDSHNGDKVALIVGNPEMIDAYKAGIPFNGKPVPDGARMAKTHWTAKKDEAQPGEPIVPDGVLKKCFPDRLTDTAWLPKLKEIIPTFGVNLIEDAAACDHIRAETAPVLKINNV
jgi:Cytochrome P460/Malate:quinone oxidoreductase (Mqo)